ncbi:chloride channel protein [Aureimonas sp. AU4]|uniref:chloride channel protein n=1 Tax=Aureimonas sp. AU4 TaxID=1638163 RepID=UPI0009EB5E70|nr:chloride channel protein [Aureimonas sp. AU4]
MSATDALRSRVRRLREASWRETLRRLFRRSEIWFVLLAALVGGASGTLTVLISRLAYAIQVLLFRLPQPERLSAQASLELWQLAILPLGGLALGLFGLAVRARRRALVDAVEANALHGGRMSGRDSLVIAGQTVISNGFGASVGLEAAYAQMGGAAASLGGRLFALRRADFRTLTGAGAGAGIAAAFGAPLVGAFYAFEIVIGAYTPAAIAPVVAASLAGALAAEALGAKGYVLHVAEAGALDTASYLAYAGLGVAAALFGIALMRLVALLEERTRPAWLPRWLRPVVGGLLLVPIALLSPQTLSAGHGAMHLDIAAGAGIGLVAAVFLLKSLASVVSLGFGFRGGLFFASLFLGTLLGHLFAAGLAAIVGRPLLDGGDAAVVGMAALAVSVIGGPMTMAMLVLETTQDFALVGAVLAASLIASLIVRELFGYSFSTWRLHLRGETVKSARDVGWVRTLTAGRMMRRDARTIPETATIAEFRRRFPLGSVGRVVLLDDAGHYAGIVPTASAFGEGLEAETPVGTLMSLHDAVLQPGDDIRTAMHVFDETGADEVVVLAPDGSVLGVLSESHARRRYAEELEKAQRDLFGER